MDTYRVKYGYVGRGIHVGIVTILICMCSMFGVTRTGSEVMVR